MNLRLFIASSAFGCLLTPSLLAQELTLEQVYNAALKNTESVRMAEQRENQARERMEQSDGALLPTISASAAYQRLDDTGQPNFDTDNSTAKLTLQQPLFRGFGEYAARRSAEHELSARSAGVQQARIDLYTQVARAYYDLANQEQEIENINTLIELTERRVKDLKQRMRIGRSRDTEVLTAEAQVANLESQQQQAKTALSQAQDKLMALTGLSGKIKVATKSSQVEQIKLPEVTSQLKSLENRPDLKALREESASLTEQTAIARAGHWPSLDLTGNYYLHREGALKDSNWDISLGLTVPLYQGGIVSSRVREYAAKAAEKNEMLHQAEREARVDLQAAHERVAGGLAQVKTLEKAFKVSEANYKAHLRDYRYSLVTHLEVLQALNSFQETKRTLDKARFQTLIAYAELQAEAAAVPGMSAGASHEPVGNINP